MQKIIHIRFLIFLIFLFPSLFSFSQATRTWVSGVGDDVNPCSRTAPGKTFAGAISKTAVGGEINVLDPGGFGSVNITKSITISGGSVGASIMASFTSGITINAGVDGVVTLRYLSINGAGNGTSGIKIISAKKVIIEHCFITGFTQKGIEIITEKPCMVILNDVTIQRAEDAILVNTQGGAVMADHCKFQSQNNAGVNLVNGQVILNNSNIVDCKTGIISLNKSSVSLSNNFISNNETAFQSAGAINSYGNNTLVANKTQGSTLTMIKLQ